MAAKEDHGKDAGKKPVEKKAELVPVDKLIDALQEGLVTTVTDVSKHMEVYGDAKPKIEEVLRTLPRKKPTEPTTKVKPNPQEIEKIREVISKFIPYVKQMQKNGEIFRTE